MADPSRCVVCKAGLNRRRLIEADWADGMSASGISKVMGDAGWQVSSTQILTHLKNHVDGAATRTPPKLSKRDAAVYVRDRLMDELEKREMQAAEAAELRGDEESDFSLLDKHLQPAIGSMLKAQTQIDKREAQADKRKIDLFRLMLGEGGGLAPRALIGDGISEGEYVEVGDGDEGD